MNQLLSWQLTSNWSICVGFGILNPNKHLFRCTQILTLCDYANKRNKIWKIILFEIILIIQTKNLNFHLKNLSKQPLFPNVVLTDPLLHVFNIGQFYYGQFHSYLPYIIHCYNSWFLSNESVSTSPFNAIT